MLEPLIKYTTPFKEQKLIGQTEYTANKSTFVTFNNQSKSTENKPKHWKIYNQYFNNITFRLSFQLLAFQIQFLLKSSIKAILINKHN